MDESRATYKYTWASLRAVSRVHMVHKTSPCTIRLRLITGQPLRAPCILYVVRLYVYLPGTLPMYVVCEKQQISGVGHRVGQRRA